MTACLTTRRNIDPPERLRTLTRSRVARVVPVACAAIALSVLFFLSGCERSQRSITDKNSAVQPQDSVEQAQEREIKPTHDVDTGSRKSVNDSHNAETGGKGHDIANGNGVDKSLSSANSNTGDISVPATVSNTGAGCDPTSATPEGFREVVVRTYLETINVPSPLPVTIFVNNRQIGTTDNRGQCRLRISRRQTHHIRALIAGVAGAHAFISPTSKKPSIDMLLSGGGLVEKVELFVQRSDAQCHLWFFSPFPSEEESTEAKPDQLPKAVVIQSINRAELFDKSNRDAWRDVAKLVSTDTASGVMSISKDALVRESGAFESGATIALLIDATDHSGRIFYAESIIGKTCL